MKNKIIAWWSGGVTSAYACLWAIRTFYNVDIVFIDTKNEHPDTYRFLADCERLYDRKIKTISRFDDSEYSSIEDIWSKYNTLTTAHGAICSTMLKREVRESYQDLLIHYGQVFGFDPSEKKRHVNMMKNYPEINAMSPLIVMNITKDDCVRSFAELGIKLPEPYLLGFRNNNCFNTGCVKGGIGYWQKLKREHSEKFNAMAEREHKFTNAAGEPRTICKDQAEDNAGELVFLKPHPDYPNHKDISMKKGREPEPLPECNGFCSTKD